jgi:hypothetical protein
MILSSFFFVDVTSFYHYIHLLLSISLNKKTVNVFLRHIQLKTREKIFYEITEIAKFIFGVKLFRKNHTEQWNQG